MTFASDEVPAAAAVGGWVTLLIIGGIVGIVFFLSKR